MNNIILGVDPDLLASGLAISTDGVITSYQTISFPDLMDYMNFDKDRIKKVVIEAGWLNKKSNFHARSGQSKSVGERIAKNVGENHATGKLICAMCEHYGILVHLVRPTSKKLNASEFERLTGISKRMNQDMRDAILLIYAMK